MMRVVIAMLALPLAAAPAFAFRCPQEIAALDEVLRAPGLPDYVKDELMKYRKRAEELHNAGKHPGAEKVIAQAAAALEHAH